MVLENIDETSGERKSQSIINTGKLMRVIPTLHFVNRVHNKLICPGDITFTTLKIFHYGYALPDKEYMEFKKERTTRLLLLDAQDRPEDPDPLYTRRMILIHSYNYLRIMLVLVHTITERLMLRVQTLMKL
jgi:hypothetical protein